MRAQCATLSGELAALQGELSQVSAQMRDEQGQSECRTLPASPCAHAAPLRRRRVRAERTSCRTRCNRRRCRRHRCRPPAAEAELQEAVEMLRRQYSEVGDRLEAEQNLVQLLR